MKLKTHKTQLLFAAMVVALVAAMIYGLLNRPAEKTSVQDAKTVTHSTDTPSEKKPDASYVWKGAPNDPKKIVIPSIGVDAYVQNVGVDQDDQVAVPTNIHIAGWFVDSVRPGQKGLSIIDGHLDGPRMAGIFINLEDVEKSDTLTIEFGNGDKKTFVVQDVKTVDLDKAANVLYSQDPKITNQLNLITCGGTYNREKKIYDKRVIVIAKYESSN